MLKAGLFPYVGYAYVNGLAQGTGATTFGGKSEVTASQYITFLLRALGFQSGVDFEWDQAWLKSDEIGLTDGTYNAASEFFRGDVAILSYQALAQNLKLSETTLLGQLYLNGAVSSEKIAMAGLTDLVTRRARTSVEIYEQASPAIFYIEVFSSAEDQTAGDAFASGSGFFITGDGIAVPNFHVIEKTAAAVITMPDQGLQYPVEQILYYNSERDIAVLKISKTDTDGTQIQAFPYLRMLSSAYLSNAEKVYAIGSPLGLQNSISDGMISNTARILDDEALPYIQFTASISSGSSGGALLNEYGEVIGITTATIEDSQNLNLAVPLDSIIDLDLTGSGMSYAQFFQEYLDAKAALKANSTGYAAYPSVPDFGRYFGINPGSTYSDAEVIGYSYDINHLSEEEIYNLLNGYHELLEAWDFIYEGYVVDETSEVHFYSNAAGVELCYGLSEDEGDLSIVVLIFL
jgi:hypothetical protein